MVRIYNFKTHEQLSTSRGYSVFTIKCCLLNPNHPRNQLSLTVLSGHRWKPWQQSQNRSWHDCSLDKDITHKWSLLFPAMEVENVVHPWHEPQNGSLEDDVPFSNRWFSGVYFQDWFPLLILALCIESSGHLGRNLAAKPTLRSIHFARKFRNLEIHPFFHHFALHRCLARFDVMGCLMVGKGGRFPGVRQGGSQVGHWGLLSFLCIPVVTIPFQYGFCINETAKQAV